MSATSLRHSLLRLISVPLVVLCTGLAQEKPQEKHRCFQETATPKTKSKDSPKPQVTAAGRSPNPEELASIEDAIATIERWEKDHDLAPYSKGKKKSSESLRDRLKQKKICVETIKTESGRKATTYRFDDPRSKGEWEYSGVGSPAIHINPAYLPAEAPLPAHRKYQLALILLHESGHLQDNKQDYPSYVEMERPVYLWWLQQAAVLLALPESEKPLINALNMEIDDAQAFLSAPPQDQADR